LRLFHASTAAALLTSMAGPAPGQSAAAQTDPPASAKPRLNDIIVTGRRDSDKYRLPPQFRPVKEDPADRSRRNLTRDWSCHNVGPRGCPMQLNRIIGIGSDGSVHVGGSGARK
jgi:hypothetical protein